MNGNGKRWKTAFAIGGAVITFSAQTVYLGFNVGKSAERLDQVEKKQQATDDIKERVVRLETIADQTAKTVDRIDRKLDRLMERKQ